MDMIWNSFSSQLELNNNFEYDSNHWKTTNNKFDITNDSKLKDSELNKKELNDDVTSINQNWSNPKNFDLNKEYENVSNYSIWFIS